MKEKPLETDGKFSAEEYEKLIFRTIDKYHLFRPGQKVVVALSGGKDSGAMGVALARYQKARAAQLDLVGFHINFGLPFSDEVEATVRAQAENLGLQLMSCSVRDFGIDMATVSKMQRPICGSCGLIKRYLMNKVPREAGAASVATGHHGDDFLVFYLKNMLGENFSWSTKFLPLLPAQGKALAKIRPLFFVGGEQNRSYCEALGFHYIEEDVCPHTMLHCGVDRTRGKWYETIAFIEDWNPGFRKQMMGSIIKQSKLMMPDPDRPFKECSNCGETTDKDLCAFCRMVQGQEKVLAKLAAKQKTTAAEVEGG